VTDLAGAGRGPERRKTASSPAALLLFQVAQVRNLDV